MENIVLHLKHVRGVRVVLLAYVVQHHIMVAHISPGYGAYLNLGKEMIVIAPFVDGKLNLKLNQESLDRVYLDYKCDTFKIDNALVYQILSKVLKEINKYVYVKHRKSMQDSWAVFFNVHKHFLGPDHVAKQAADAERKCKPLTMMVR